MVHDKPNEELHSAILDQIPSIRYGFGTDQSPIPASFSGIWENQKPIWKQVHGIAVARVDQAGQKCGEVDALYSDVLQIPVAVITADCVPIVMAEKSGQCVAVMHAGWRGTKQQIVRAIWQELQLYGHLPKDWVAVIGPSIRPCCYEVSESLIHDFTQTFPHINPEKIAPRFRRLDLAQINRIELEKMGLSAIEVMPQCTSCHQTPHFHSYRRDHLVSGETGGRACRQYSMVMRN